MVASEPARHHHPESERKPAPGPTCGPSPQLLPIFLVFRRLGYGVGLAALYAMREIVHSALRALNLDYAITLISGGASKNYEIVMWDQPRNSFFSIRVRWETGLSREQMTQRVVQQLADRSAAWRIADVRGLTGRRRRRHGARQWVSNGAPSPPIPLRQGGPHTSG